MARTLPCSLILMRAWMVSSQIWGEGDELDIVEEEDVEVVGFEALKGDVNGFLDAFGGEIEVFVGVAAEFGAE